MNFLNNFFQKKLWNFLQNFLTNEKKKKDFNMDIILKTEDQAIESTIV